MIRIFQTVSFSEVLRVFKKEYIEYSGYRSDTHNYTRRILVNANKQFQGQWALVYLGKRQIGNIVLPWHLGEGGRVELVPKQGATLRKVLKKFDNLKFYQEYKKSNPICWRKIIYLKKQRPTPLFLTTVPLEKKLSYNDLIVQDNQLVHLDGLHRLLAWGLSNRIKGYGEIKAYIAGL